MAEPTPPPQPAPSGQPDRRALLAAYQNLVQSEQDKRQSESHLHPAEPSGQAFWVATGVVIIALSALLLLQPGWLFSKPPVEIPAVNDAGLRVGMYVQIERIERFRSDSGRLPASLAEAAVPEEGLTLQVFDGEYTLTGVNGASALVYSSGTPPDSFLGDSYRIIRERGRP